MDNPLTVNIRKSPKDIAKDRTNQGIVQRRRRLVEDVGEGQRHVRKGEDEALLLVTEGLDEGDAWRTEGLQDLDFAEGIVRLDGVDDDFEGGGAGAEDFGCDAV